MVFSRRLALVATLLAAPTISAQLLPEVIFSEVTTSTTSTVPGALDASGTPVDTDFTAIADLHVSPDGTQWILKATTAQPNTEANVMLLGSGTTGSIFAQEGQPVGGGAPGEVYDFFDGVAGFNSTNQFAFGARARDGVAGTLEKVIFFDGTNETIRVQQGDPALGLLDLPPAPSGDETFGNSLNSIHLLDDGTVGFVAVTLDNVSSFRRPALFYDDQAFLQSGVDTIGSETWDSFDSNDFRTTRDGMHYVVQGDTENSNAGADDILVVDGVIVAQEGVDLGGGVNVDGIFASRIYDGGSWIARGDVASDDDWVLHNGTVIAQTGSAVTTTSSLVWGDIILLVSQTPSGQPIIAGNTSNPDPNLDQVLVVGDEVVLQEGDVVDLDQNGAADDDAFIRTFQPDDAHVTPDGMLYLLVTLRNAAGDNLGDAFIRTPVGTAPVAEFIRGDSNEDGGLDIADAIFALNLLFGTGGTVTCDDANDSNDDGGFDISDAIYTLAALFSSGSNPGAPFPNCGDDPTPDGFDCVDFASCP
ncbi:MAG: hypothetical protein AAF488_13455 [Planctomycetota bacterium]